METSLDRSAGEGVAPRAGEGVAPRTGEGVAPRTGETLAPRIRRHQPLLGTVVSVPDAALAELVCERLDFVWIDLEHGQLGVREAQIMAIAARAAGCAALVRLPHPDSDLLPALLDAGIDGVVAPRLEDPGAARRLVERLRYPPWGTRGTAPRRANSYGRVPAVPNGTGLACVVQIETAAAVENAAEIASVEGVDAVVVGCSDLSFDLGTPGELESAPLLTAVTQVQRAAAGAGVASGIAAHGPAAALARVLAGRSTIVVYSSDVRIYARAVDDAVAGLAGVLASEGGAGGRAWPST
jgi:4-hydroxy-2-oxoheptanedioate aldolase